MSNFFVNQLLQERGKKLPSLDYLGYGEPTTYGTSFVYSQEVASSLQHPRVKKGTMNKGSSGMTAAPWAENVVQDEKMVSVYGTDFVKSASVEERYNTEEILAKNRELKKKQRAEALIRQEQLFTESRAAYDLFMKEERRRYNDAQKKYENRTSRVFDHKGVSIRNKLSDVELFKQQLDRVQENELKIRNLVPRLSAKTPQPTLDMLKTCDDSKLNVPLRAKSVAGGEGIFEGHLDGLIRTNTTDQRDNEKAVLDAKNKKRNLSNAIARDAESPNPSGQTLTETPPINPSGSPISQHVYPADKQRIKFMRLEALRHQSGKTDLIRHGWAEATSPLGEDKKPHHPEEYVGLDEEAFARVDAAVLKRKQDDMSRREANVARKALEEQQLQEQIRQMDILSRQPGVHRSSQKNFTQIMERLLSDSSARITVPRNLGILQPTSEDAIREKAKTVPAGQYKTSIAGSIPAKSVEGDQNGEDGDIASEGDLGSPKITAAGKKQNSNDHPYNIISNVDDVAQQDDANETHNSSPPLGRRYMHSHLPVYNPNKQPLDPTRKDIDRELRTVVHGGHLLKDRSTAISALGPEKVAYIKSLNAESKRYNPAHGIASVSGGGGGARMAKPMKPIIPGGKTSLL